jgi:hypothetical protein
LGVPVDAREIVPHFNDHYCDVVKLDTLPIKLSKSSFGRGGHSGENTFEEDPFVPDETTVVIDWE